MDDKSKSAGGFANLELQTVTLPADAFDRFVAICENPPPPTQALIDLMRKAPPWDGK